MSNTKWTTANISNLTGKVIIVTGGNSGLGYESVKAFSEKGAEVILTSRSMEKGEAAKAEINITTRNRGIYFRLKPVFLKYCFPENMGVNSLPTNFPARMLWGIVRYNLNRSTSRLCEKGKILKRTP